MNVIVAEMGYIIIVPHSGAILHCQAKLTWPGEIVKLCAVQTCSRLEQNRFVLIG
jgi:hypothetical protein